MEPLQQIPFSPKTILIYNFCGKNPILTNFHPGRLVRYKLPQKVLYPTSGLIRGKYVVVLMTHPPTRA